MKAVGELRRRRLDDELHAARAGLPPRPSPEREAFIIALPAHALGIAIKERRITSLEAVALYCHRALYVGSKRISRRGEVASRLERVA